MLGFHQHCFTTAAGAAALGGADHGGEPWDSALTPPATPTSPTPSSHAASQFKPSGKRAARSVESSPERPAERPSEAASGWSLRSRRHRLSARPAKRLFTPAIKKMLKGWLVRRRDNPYPSRAEKETLATRTGLTYMQVCNWFANWRRKLRDCGRPEDGVDDGAGGQDGEGSSVGDTSWAHLIRRYNAIAAAGDATNGQEHFSISSGDSIWAVDRVAGASRAESRAESPSSPQQNACVSSTTTETEAAKVPGAPAPHDRGDAATGRALSTKASTATKASPDAVLGEAGSALDSSRSGSALLLSKWLESAARYQPSPAPANAKQNQKPPTGWGVASAAVEHTLEGRHREELDAAEALAFLSSLRFR